MKTVDMCLLAPQGNALLGSQFVRAWVLQISNFGPSGHRLFLQLCWMSKLSKSWLDSDSVTVSKAHVFTFSYKIQHISMQLRLRHTMGRTVQRRSNEWSHFCDTGIATLTIFFGNMGTMQPTFKFAFCSKWQTVVKSLLDSPGPCSPLPLLSLPIPTS